MFFDFTDHCSVVFMELTLSSPRLDQSPRVVMIAQGLGFAVILREERILAVLLSCDRMEKY